MMASNSGRTPYDPALAAVAGNHRNQKMKERKRASHQRRDEEREREAWSEELRTHLERQREAWPEHLRTQFEANQARLGEEVERVREERMREERFRQERMRQERAREEGERGRRGDRRGIDFVWIRVLAVIVGLVGYQLWLESLRLYEFEL